MKHLYFICICLLVCTLSGCSVNSDWDENSLAGTWQLEAAYSSSGGPGSWSTVEDGFTYKFQRDGKFFSNRFEECGQGTYSTTANELTLNYNCEGFVIGSEDAEGVLVEEFRFEGKSLFLTPKYLLCIEGCSYKFRKIAPADKD